jgi:hypothetical protein
MPLCEALSSRRGRGPHHAHKDRVGTWEVPRLTTGHVPTWSALGRRGAVADDARTWEVGLRHSSCEAGEQSGASCCGAVCGGCNCGGVGGAKGGDQGECGPAKHVPDAERSLRPSAHRYSIVMLRSSIQPSSRSRCIKAAIRWLSAEGVVEPRSPIVGSLSVCCARAASGHAAAAPPRSVMKSRRFTRSPRPRWRVAAAALRGRAPWRSAG